MDFKDSSMSMKAQVQSELLSWMPFVGILILYVNRKFSHVEIPCCKKLSKCEVWRCVVLSGDMTSEKRRKSGGAVAGSSWLSGSRHQRSPGHGLSPSKSKTAAPGNTPSASNSPEWSWMSMVEVKTSVRNGRFIGSASCHNLKRNGRFVGLASCHSCIGRFSA